MRISNFQSWASTLHSTWSVLLQEIWECRELKAGAVSVGGPPELPAMSTVEIGHSLHIWFGLVDHRGEITAPSQRRFVDYAMIKYKKSTVVKFWSAIFNTSILHSLTLLVPQDWLWVYFNEIDSWDEEPPTNGITIHSQLRRSIEDIQDFDHVVQSPSDTCLLCS